LFLWRKSEVCVTEKICKVTLYKSILRSDVAKICFKLRVSFTPILPINVVSVPTAIFMTNLIMIKLETGTFLHRGSPHFQICAVACRRVQMWQRPQTSKVEGDPKREFTKTKMLQLDDFVL